MYIQRRIIFIILSLKVNWFNLKILNYVLCEKWKEIMILIKENKRGEERHIGERRESRKSRITKVTLWAICTHTPPQAGV